MYNTSNNNNDWNFMNYSNNMTEPLQEPVAFEGTFFKINTHLQH